MRFCIGSLGEWNIIFWLLEEHFVLRPNLARQCRMRASYPSTANVPSLDAQCFDGGTNSPYAFQWSVDANSTLPLLMDRQSLPPVFLLPSPTANPAPKSINDNPNLAVFFLTRIAVQCVDLDRRRLFRGAQGSEFCICISAPGLRCRLWRSGRIRTADSPWNFLQNVVAE